MPQWWETFFDADYLRIWEGAEEPGRTERQATGLWDLLGLTEGSRVLDAPCGYGRISRALADRGAHVVGVDFSQDLLAEAESRRNGIPAAQLQYRRHDLRTPLFGSEFDAALNIFSSLGYGSESDDLAILKTLCRAIRPGGFVFVETNHRDNLFVSKGQPPGQRLPDGTLLVEKPRFDPVAGRFETTWYWSGPSGSGQKSGSIRIYTATELAKLVEAAGLEVRGAYQGCSVKPFQAPDGTIGARLGLLAVRP